MTDVNATDINRALAGKYSGAEWRIWFEVSQGTGAYSGRRADAVALNIWPSKDYQLHVFEVKVSRSDFKNEMKDLSKWKAVGQYGDFFWLVAPVGLVKPDEVPAEWGLMELTKGGLRVKKQAPVREATPIDRSFAASLLRSGQDLTQAEIDRRVNEGIAAETRKITERADKNAMMRTDRLQEKVTSHDTWIKEFEAAFGCRPNMYQSATMMAQRILLAEKLERKDFQRLADQATGLATLINELPDHGKKPHAPNV